MTFAPSSSSTGKGAAFPYNTSAAPYLPSCKDAALSASQTLLAPTTPSSSGSAITECDLQRQQVERESSKHEWEEMGLGCTVRLMDLRSKKYNDSFGVVTGCDSTTGRWYILVSNESRSVKIKPENIQFPARCPACECWVSAVMCYACGYEGPSLPGLAEE